MTISLRLLDSFLSTSYLGNKMGPKYCTPRHNHQRVVTPNEIVGLCYRDNQLNDPLPFFSGFPLVLGSCLRNKFS